MERIVGWGAIEFQQESWPMLSEINFLLTRQPLEAKRICFFTKGNSGL
jgi:hypothetical protein